MNFEYIKDTVFKTVDFSYLGQIEFCEYEGVYVSLKDGNAVIGADSAARFARGCFLFAMNVSEGKCEFQISEKPRFNSLGCMLDCSRNAVMKPDMVKKYINCIASLGFNTLILYTEDTFEVEGRPRFGYLRGRYTAEEIKDIVAYGETMGVELIPHIQTLGHLRQYIKWSRIGAPDYTGEHIYELTDTSSVILCESDETYRFIEDMLKTCRECFRSNRIHIGMDEAHDLGLGQYKNLHGFKDRFEIMIKHLDRVIELCAKYDFKPIMYSDMFFRLANKNGIYEDDSVTLPEEILKQIPDCEIMFWDYYQKDQSYYEGMLLKHRLFKRPVAFMGGLATWYGFLPSYKYAYRNSSSALKACLKYEVNTVITSAWGDDGNECNAFLANSLLAVYSEYCYKGDACTDGDIARASEYLTKIKAEDAEAMGSLMYDTEYTPEGFMVGKRLFYGDILYDMAIAPEAAWEAVEIYAKAKQRMAELMELKDKNYLKYQYAFMLYSICGIKAELAQKLRRAYKDSDRDYIGYAVNQLFPELKKLYADLLIIHKEQWNSTYKPFGFEVLNFRYGGLIARVDFALDKLKDYYDGKIAVVEELEEKILVNEGGYLQSAVCLVSPSYTL